MLKIIVADDHPIVRRGLRQIVEETEDIIISAEASDGFELLDKVSKNHYDVAVVDITMPGNTGNDIVKKLRSINPGLPILILSIHPEEQFGISMLKAGASGYLIKSEAPERLIDAIKKVSRGQKYISPHLAEILADSVTCGNDKPPSEVLSNREYQIFNLLASGKTGKSISRELSLSIKTVSTYKTRILQKLNLTNTAELIHFAVNNHLTD